MQFSISVLLAIAIAAPAYAAVVARIEGDITGRTPLTVCVIDQRNYWALTDSS
jgi:hypothetical protein